MDTAAHSFLTIFYLYQQQSYGQWQIVFGILAITYLLGSLSFLIFGSGELQSWNNPEITMEDDQEAGQPLKDIKPNGNAAANEKNEALTS